MKKILLTGSNGLLGQNLISQLIDIPSVELHALSRSANVHPLKEGYSFHQIDITDQTAVTSLFNDLLPDVVIHAAAMTQVDPCELNPDLCQTINVLGTQFLAQAAEQVKARFVYISTDFVFDGEAGPYRENDIPNPVSVYGKTKLHSEEITKKLKVPWAIVRTILVYGICPSMSRSNLVLWVKDSLENAQAIQVVNDQYRMPTLVDDLAQGIVELIMREKSGIYHLSGPDYASVYDFACQTADFFKLDKALITAIPSSILKQPGKRPPNTGFDLTKAQKELDFRPKSFVEGLKVVQNLLQNQ